jgi:UDP-glucose 4-epimerase
MAEKAIVTGAAGFIGSHLCEALLARGCDVIGIDCFTSNYDPRIKRDNIAGIEGDDRFTFLEASPGDLDLEEVLVDAAYVFHAAARPGVRDSWRERFGEYVQANIQATQQLCEAATAVPIKRFVYSSSSSVYGETAELPMGESHPTRPHSPYGVTKLAGEALCVLYKRNFDLPAVALRYFTVYGPRQRTDMAFHKFIKSTLDGKAIEVYGNGTQTRDFTYVSDIVEANLLAMEYEGEEAVFNIGGGSTIALSGVLDILTDELSGEVDVKFVDRVKGDVTHTSADIGLARSELGYSPKMALDEGVHNEVQWVKSIRQKLGEYR